MDTLKEFCTNFYVVSAFRLLVGFFLAGIIGAERESLNKPAGFKTHALIGISGVLVVILSEYWYKYCPNFDMARIPAQILSGIGFIGAGTILIDGFNVKGLTTATSLLLVTCIGLSIGAGFYVGGILATFLAYVILSYSKKFPFEHDHLDTIQFNIHIVSSDKIMQKIEAILDRHKIKITKINTSLPDEFNRKLVKFICTYNNTMKLNKVLTDISDLNNVIEIETDKDVTKE